MNKLQAPGGKMVFLTDSLSAIQAIEAKSTDSTVQNLKRELSQLSEMVESHLQWIPSHCGIAGNESADVLAKEGSAKEQIYQPLSFQEVKTIIQRKSAVDWKTNTGYDYGKDSLKDLSRTDQVIIFRLRTGHCRLNKHLYRLGISQTALCQCQQAEQTPEHILQDCPLLGELRINMWPHPVDLKTKLWGNLTDLKLTAQFVVHSKLSA